MKKSVLFVVFMFLLLSISIVTAQENMTVGEEQIDKAYECLKEKVINNCDQLSVEDKIFSVMAIGECQNELILTDSLNSECWPKTKCTLKTTGQAILALHQTTKSTTGAEEWLISENTSPSDIVWYLQIESPKETTCSIKYGASTYKVIVRDDRTLNSAAGHCLTLSSDDWWLKVSPGCYDQEFEISCDESFRTDLLFQRKASSIIHVSGRENSASANGRTTEKINSACFKQDGKCNYEGSLWAALALHTKGYSVDAFMPYLTTMAEENTKYLPDAFLYGITGQDDYRINLLLRQKASQY